METDSPWFDPNYDFEDFRIRQNFLFAPSSLVLLSLIAHRTSWEDLGVYGRGDACILSSCDGEVGFGHAVTLVCFTLVQWREGQGRSAGPF